MAPSVTKFLRDAVQPKGSEFLAHTFQFYVILELRTTRVYNVEEVVELGIVVTKVDCLSPMYVFNTFVKPTILQRISKTSQLHYGIEPPHVTENDFSKVLTLITSQDPLVAHALENGLLIISDKQIMERDFPGQCEIIQRFDLPFPSEVEMNPFYQWCCLRDLFGIVRDVALHVQGYSADKFTKEYYKTFGGLVNIYSRCAEKATALIPLLRMYTLILERQLFPTTQVIRSSNRYSSLPSYLKFRKFYTSPSIPDNIEYQSGRYAGKFDKDGIYIGSDTEEELEEMAATQAISSDTDDTVNSTSNISNPPFQFDTEFHCKICDVKFETLKLLVSHNREEHPLEAGAKKVKENE
jgi:hypothetical protein